MANLGVVPLFLLAAFLLLPLVLALRFLLFVVTFVRDTINYSKCIKYFCLIHLPDGDCNVKAITKFVLILLSSLEFNTAISQEEKETLVLAKGEQLELPVGDIKKYSMGNKEILASHVDQNNHSIYIKGKSLGFTDLILWLKNERKHYLVYVVSKKDHLEHAKILELFPTPSWKANFVGDAVSLNGIIVSRRQWNGLYTLLERKIPLDLDDVAIDKNLRKVILSDLYKELYQLGMENFSCNLKRIPWIDCWGKQDLNTEQIDIIKKQFPNLVWLKINKFTPLKNIRVKVKIISFDYSQGEDWQKGLDYLKGHLNEIFDLGIWPMLKRNPINFEKYWNKVSVLAEPEFTLIPNTEAKFNIGSEIPYYKKSASEDTQQIEWKFAGLSVEMKVNQTNDDQKLKVQYKTQLTSPSQEQIEGHQQMSELLVEKKSNIVLFDISYKTTSQGKHSVPFWSKIPILNLLFDSEHDHQNNKKILAILNLKDL